MYFATRHADHFDRRVRVHPDLDAPPGRTEACAGGGGCGAGARDAALRQGACGDAIHRGLHVRAAAPHLARAA